eukprot:3152461-Rhodomonas_salina.1
MSRLLRSRPHGAAGLRPDRRHAGVTSRQLRLPYSMPAQDPPSSALASAASWPRHVLRDARHNKTTATARVDLAQIDAARCCGAGACFERCSRRQIAQRRCRVPTEERGEDEGGREGGKEGGREGKREGERENVRTNTCVRVCVRACVGVGVCVRARLSMQVQQGSPRQWHFDDMECISMASDCVMAFRSHGMTLHRILNEYIIQPEHSLGAFFPRTQQALNGFSAIFATLQSSRDRQVRSVAKIAENPLRTRRTLGKRASKYGVD